MEQEETWGEGGEVGTGSKKETADDREMTESKL